MTPLIKLNCSCDTAVSRVTSALNDAELRAVISFDSQRTRTASPVNCPHHGSAVCDCQVMILLIYDAHGEPATLLAHGQDGETWISLVFAADQRPALRLENHINLALRPLSTA